MKRQNYIFLFCFLFFAFTFQSPTLKIALLKYSGGGDWYNDVHSLRNLVDFCNKNLGTNFFAEHETVEVGNPAIFDYPVLYMTGHGNVIFSTAEAENLRKYLKGGGFLIINDDFGIDPYIRPAFKKVFPDVTFKELPNNHAIYHQGFKFSEGLPKIHEHDGLPAKGYGLFVAGRMVAFYNFESDLGDGWDDVHNDSPASRTLALRMGSNIIQYAFSN